ncbi:hypothetical protein M0802_013210 [Mischocyttarus mexicanus]|nr:hypothetical protein M0802_013210 [Mischocyttarus mexicanus]
MHSHPQLISSNKRNQRKLTNVIDKDKRESTALKWSAKFKNGDLDIDDTPRSGRPSEFDEERLKAPLKEDGHQTRLELVEKMNCDHKTILNHPHSKGFTEKLGAWVPHVLRENNNGEYIID